MIHNASSHAMKTSQLFQVGRPWQHSKLAIGRIRQESNSLDRFTQSNVLFSAALKTNSRSFLINETD